MNKGEQNDFEGGSRMNNDDMKMDAKTNKVDRRKFLQISAMFGAGMAVPSLAGCSASKSTETAAPVAVSTPSTVSALPYYPTVKLPVPASNGKKNRIGVAFQPALVFWQRYQASFLLRLEELGEEPVIVWTGPAFNENIVGIESLIQQKPDVIVLGGNTKEIFLPILPEIKKQGIKFVGMQNDTPGVPMVTEDKAWGAGLSINGLFESINGKGNIVLYYVPGLHFTVDYVKKVMDVILQFYPEIKVIETLPVRFPDSEKAGMEDTENLLRRYKKGDIQALYCPFDGPLFGALQAVKAAGLENDIKVSTSSGDDHVWEAMAAGDPSWVTSTFTDFWEIGRRTADMAVMAARGATPPSFSFVYGCAVNKSNALEYSKIIKEQNKIAEATLKKYGKK